MIKRSGSAWVLGMTKGTKLLALILFLCTTFAFPGVFGEEDRTVTIRKGSSLNMIAKQLKREGFIKSETLFKLHIKRKHLATKLRAGTFFLSFDDGVSEIASKLTTQSGVASYMKVTIPEGFNSMQIAARLEKQGVVDADAYLTYLNTNAKADFVGQYPFLDGAPSDNLEGYLYPNTYYFTQTSTPRSITEQFLKQFSERIVPVWEASKSEPGSPKSRFNFHQILTLASIIEKEATYASEMTTIASVFDNRLRKRMPLAADPTVVYALGRTHKDIVTYKDTRTKSPYNTYQNTGFPPTPIASPSVAAFQAALTPKKTPYYFFVADKKGNHIFTRTYQEHLRVQRGL